MEDHGKRQTSIITDSDHVTLATIDRAAFKRVLGKLEAKMKLKDYKRSL